MNKLLLLTLSFIFSLFLNDAIAQQLGAYRIANGANAGGAPTVIELSNNRTLLVSYSSYGSDSSNVVMVWLDQNMSILQHKEFRLTLPLNYIFDAVKCNDAILIGALEYSSFGTPISIIRTDTEGNILRYDLSLNNPAFQEKIKQLIGNDDGSFTAYTSKSGSVESMYRIDGNLADTVYHTKKITPSIANDYFRPFNACDADGNGTHLLTGTTNDFAGANTNAMMIKLDSTQIHWAKSYDYGAASSEESNSIIQLASGNFAFTGRTHPTGSTFMQGVVTVTDTDGNNLWSKLLSLDGGGINPTAIVQTANGDILVFGNTQTYDGILVKLSATGSTIWTKRFTGATGMGFTDAIRQADDKILAVGVAAGVLLDQLDEEGNGCLWVDDASILVTDISPTVNTIAFEYTAVEVSFAPYPVKPREMNTTSTALCSSTSVQENYASASSISIFPNPAEEVCYLNSASNEVVRYTLYNALGKKITEGTFVRQTTLTLNDYPQGLYLLGCTVHGKEEVIKLMH